MPGNRGKGSPSDETEQEVEQVPIQDEVSELYRHLIDSMGGTQTMLPQWPHLSRVMGSSSATTEARCSGVTKVAWQLGHIFADHRTATYVTKMRSVKPLASDTALLHAVVAMVPPGAKEIMPDRNAIQTVVARRDRDGWSVALFKQRLPNSMGDPGSAKL
jgi:uncharacterized protein (TIGR02246 family)